MPRRLALFLLPVVMLPVLMLPVLMHQPAHAATDPFFTAMDALARQDGRAALQILQPLADAGEADAENAVGLVHERGAGVPADPAEAAQWYRRASDRGLNAATVNLGVLLMAGAGLPRDQAEALRLYHQAASRGSLRAMLLLGGAYRNGTGQPPDLVAARGWFLKAAQGGMVDGMYEAARLLLSSADAAEREQGRTWLQKAADIGFPKALALLGMGKLTGAGGTAPDPPAGAAMLRRAAAQGDADAAAALAAAYGDGLGVTASGQDALAWTERAAQLGHAASQVQLARNRLAARDPEGALYWASIAGRLAPPGLKPDADGVAAQASRGLTPEQRTEQARRAGAWRPRVTWQD